MRKQKLTKKEQEFWDKYVEYHIQLLRSPTREELARYTRISQQLVQYYIKILREKGYIDSSKK